MAEILNIKKALERRLQAITPTVPTGFEGVNFDPPVNAMYQRCQFMIGKPQDPTLTIGFSRERLQMQVFICDVKGTGTGAALARAELIRNTFAKGLSLIESGTRIYVLETPHIGSAMVVGDRIIVPVMIDAIGEVFV